MKNDEWIMIKDEGFDDFKLLRGFDYIRTDRLMDGWTLVNLESLLWLKREKKALLLMDWFRKEPLQIMGLAFSH